MNFKRLVLQLLIIKNASQDVKMLVYTYRVIIIAVGTLNKQT